MLETAAKLGIKLFLTAGNSPWSNGKNERNHYSCDMTIDKLLAENPKMSLSEALSHATYAHNVQINKKGFSPMQLVFGRQSVVPGITDGNLASMEPVVESDWFRSELINRQKAEELYRKIDFRSYWYKEPLVQQMQFITLVMKFCLKRRTNRNGLVLP